MLNDKTEKTRALKKRKKSSKLGQNFLNFGLSLKLGLFSKTRNL
jgi:hypothetical protein